MTCPITFRAELFSTLVSMVQFAKRSNLDVPAAFLEELIDACVLAVREAQIISAGNRAKPGSLYFPEEAASKSLRFIDPVSALLNVDAASCRVAPAKTAAPSAHRSSAARQDAASTQSIETFHATANAPSHPLRNQLLRLAADSPDLFAVIKQEGRV